MLAIEVDNVYKSYEGLSVLRGLNVRVPEGQVYGLLGPNGTGKSTLMHLLLGFLKPQKGRIRVLGDTDMDRIRSKVGYLPERLRYHLRYTAREYLRYLGSFNDMQGAELERRVNEELAAVKLTNAADRLLATYSKGMLQRLGIAQALMHDPRVLLIDEPTAGLDPAGQREMLDLLMSIRDRGHTIFLTTHFLDEVEYLCDRVGILFDGKLAAEVDVASLRAPGRNATIGVSALPRELAVELEQLSPAIRCTTSEIQLQPNEPALQEQVLRALLDAHVPIISLEPHGRPLEELYLRVVRGEAIGTTVEDSTTAHSDPEAYDPPNNLFAPPGHPDTIQSPETHVLPVEPPRGSGDTLLRDLLRQKENHDS